MTVFVAPLALLIFSASPEPGSYFKIKVVDEQTGRGVPLVELRTVNEIKRVTDSNGLVAFHEPGLMGRDVFFHVKSHGYEYPADRFGFHGQALRVKEGGSAVLKIRRTNIAERLYRVTGEGIYADSLLLGERAPIREPSLNAQVFGSDSVVNAVFKGRIYWFWGDTNRMSYPLGNFDVPGATSALPRNGGLDPAVGVDLEYFLDEGGFAKPTARMPGPGPTWISSLSAFRDASGRERLFGIYAKVRNTLEVYERGLVEFDDESKQFVKVTTFLQDAPIYPEGHTFLRTEGGITYVYFANPFPLTRVRSDPDWLPDPSRYETFTCLKPEGRARKWTTDRDAQGRIRYAWKANTLLAGMAEQNRLVDRRLLKADEVLLPLRDVPKAKQVLAHGGSVYWNNYRNRWVMICVEQFGTSMLGEVWFAEADTPVGPWVYACKIATHDKYSFYNPKQHPVFDKDGGRTIFFEGTYTVTFSGNDAPTPRYDYNQVMYKLDLADPRLNLPVAVYRISETGASDHFGTIRRESLPRSGRSVAFFALERPGEGTVAIYEQPTEGGGIALGMDPPPPNTSGRPNPPLFYALPPSAASFAPSAVPLYEYASDDGRTRTYSADAGSPPAGLRRSGRPVCIVWRNPCHVDLTR
jgi:hypothetical protein